jgi:hypothetical protein
MDDNLAYGRDRSLTPHSSVEPETFVASDTPAITALIGRVANPSRKTTNGPFRWIAHLSRRFAWVVILLEVNGFLKRRITQ